MSITVPFVDLRAAFEAAFAEYCGATPVFVDCLPGTANIDPGQIEAALTAHTRAIVRASELSPIVEAVTTGTPGIARLSTTTVGTQALRH